MGCSITLLRQVCILYARKVPRVKPRVDLCGTKLQWVNTVKHLGNYLDKNVTYVKIDFKMGLSVRRQEDHVFLVGVLLS